MKLIWVLLILLSVNLNAESKYLTFPGEANNYVFNNELLINNEAKELTVELKLRYKGPSQKAGVLLLGEKASSAYFAVVLSAKGAVEVWMHEADSEQIVVSSEETLAPDKWHDVAIVYNGNAIDADSSVQNALALKLFFNGRLIASKLLGNTELVPLSLSGMQGIKLGSVSGTKNFRGGIAETRIWSKALNRELVAEWLNKSVDDTHPLHESLICHYEMVENAEGKITDEAGAFSLSYFGAMTGKNVVDNTTGSKFIETLSEDDPDYFIFNSSAENLYTLGRSDRDPFHEVVKERDPSELLPQEIKAVKDYLAGYELRAVVKGRTSICFFNKGKLKIGDVIDLKVGNTLISLKVDRIKEKPLGVVFKAGSLEVVKEIKR